MTHWYNESVNDSIALIHGCMLWCNPHSDATDSVANTRGATWSSCSCGASIRVRVCAPRNPGPARIEASVHETTHRRTTAAVSRYILWPNLSFVAKLSGQLQTCYCTKVVLIVYIRPYMDIINYNCPWYHEYDLCRRSMRPAVIYKCQYSTHGNHTIPSQFSNMPVATAIKF